jgi:hypothetical protein
VITAFAALGNERPRGSGGEEAYPANHPLSSQREVPNREEISLGGQKPSGGRLLCLLGRLKMTTVKHTRATHVS